MNENWGEGNVQLQMSVEPSYGVGPGLDPFRPYISCKVTAARATAIGEPDKLRRSVEVFCA